MRATGTWGPILVWVAVSLGSAAAETPPATTASVRAASTPTPTPTPPPPPPPPPSPAVQAFKRGLDAFQQKQFDVAVTAFAQVPELGDETSLYKHWYLGQAELELGKYKEAETEFSKIAQAPVSSELKYQAQFDLGEVALRQRKYSEVLSRLQPLERKWRHSYRYPEVLYRMMVAELRLGRTANACKRARQLYAKFSAHPLVIEWGRSLSAVQIDGKHWNCTEGEEDFANRVRSLQWSGESEKAHKELLELLEHAPTNDRLKLDLILANFLVNEGSVDDALNLLIRYYPQEKTNLNFLSLLGKAAARSGEYQTAVGAYERMYNLSSNTKKGREALFQAAALSYQFQDYDGAVRKFQQFVKANPRSGLSKDAQWNLAWLQYLRNDYRGALDRFAQVAKTMHRRRGKVDSLQERLWYWTAMAHLRLEEWAAARASFESIAARSPNSYYGLAAAARLDSIRGKSEEAKPKIPFETESTGPETLAGGGPAPAALNGSANEPAEEAESEDDLATDQEAADDRTTTDDAVDEDGSIHASTVKDPALRARIDMAQRLIQLGLFDLARWELIEVEKRTRNSQYLRLLIGAYDGIGSYNRAASLAELSFAKERDAGGLDGARPLWVAMLPQAYKAEVLAASQRFSVPQEWIWSIMRTESVYRADVISPVGAKGLMQLMTLTARNLYRVAGEPVPDGFDLLNPETNVRLGAQYLGRLGQKFNGQLALVAGAYNAGPHRVESWLVSFGQLDTDEFVEHIPFMETRNYVKRVLRAHTLYRRLYAKDNRSLAFLVKPLGVPIPSRAATRENWDSL